MSNTTNPSGTLAEFARSRQSGSTEQTEAFLAEISAKAESIVSAGNFRPEVLHTMPRFAILPIVDSDYMAQFFRDLGTWQKSMTCRERHDFETATISWRNVE